MIVRGSIKMRLVTRIHFAVFFCTDRREMVRVRLGLFDSAARSLSASLVGDLMAFSVWRHLGQHCPRLGMRERTSGSMKNRKIRSTPP